MPFLESDELYSLADKIVDGCQADPQCRFIQRVIPIEKTCMIDSNEVSKAIEDLIQRHFKVEDSTTPTYAVDFKARNNDKLTRAAVLDVSRI